MQNGFTLETYVRIDDLGSVCCDIRPLLFRGDRRSGRDPWLLGINDDGGLTLAIWDGTASFVLRSAQPVAIGKWAHVAGVYDEAAGRMRVYLNREQVGEYAAFVPPPHPTLDPTRSPAVALGNADTASQGLRGALDSPRITARALDPSEFLPPIDVCPPFRPPMRVASESGYIAVGRMNGDGIDDLVLVDFYADEVLVHLGRGDGGFDAPSRFGVGGSPWSLVIADINRDGASDVAVSNFGSDDLSVLLGDGDGRLGPHQRLGSLAGPRGIASADLDDDGNPDLITANFYGGVAVHLGNGDGTFGATMSVTTSIAMRSVATGDFNEDGVDDIAAVGSYGAYITILLGVGDGTFYPEQQTPLLYDNLSSISVGDLDDDGAEDLVVAGGFGDDSIAILLGNGDGSFQPERRLQVGQFSHAASIADLDGDSALDLAVAGQGEVLRLLYGRGDGSFHPADLLQLPGHASQVAIADLNRDGSLDLMIPHSLDDGVSVVLARQGECCYADLDGDGALTTFDFLAFQDLYVSGDPYADCDVSGELDLFDFLCFQNAFAAGCP